MGGYAYFWGYNHQVLWSSWFSDSCDGKLSTASVTQRLKTSQASLSDTTSQRPSLAMMSAWPAATLVVVPSSNGNQWKLTYDQIHHKVEART